MNYKTILNEQTTDEQLYTIHQLMKSITGMNPNEYDTYEIKMSYDEWAKHYIVEFCGDSKIQIQVLIMGCVTCAMVQHVVKSTLSKQSNQYDI